MVARGPPPGVWAPPSILGFGLRASFYLARFWLSLWPPVNSVTLGKFPNTLNLCFLICKVERTTPLLFSQVRILCV